MFYISYVVINTVCLQFVSYIVCAWTEMFTMCARSPCDIYECNTMFAERSLFI